MASEEKMREINHLYTEHYIRAANGLLCAIGTEVYNEASLGTKRELKRCFASISSEDKNPQKSEAKCILNAYNMLDKERAGVEWVGAFGLLRMKRRAMKQSRLLALGPNQVKARSRFEYLNQKYLKFRRRIAQHRARIPWPSTTMPKFRPVQQEGFNVETAEGNVRKNRNYVTHRSASARTLISLTENVLRAPKRMNDGKGQRAATRELLNGYTQPTYFARLINSAERKTFPAKAEADVLTMDHMPNLIQLETTKSPVAAFAHMATELLKDGDNSEKTSWKDTYAKIKEINYQLKSLRKIESENRAFDNVLKDRGDPFSLARTERKLQVIDGNMDPLYDLQTVNSFIDGLKPMEKENLEFLSPKFAPLMPENDTPKKSLLSPTFLSFYKDESPNNIASIPDLLNNTEWTSSDRDALMELIMEASGARMQVEQTLQGLSGLADWQDVAQAMIDANLRMNASWTTLFTSLTKMQKVELDTKGYSFASHEQISNMFFNNDSYYSGTWRNDIPLEEYKNYDDNDRKRLLRSMVGIMAGDNSTEIAAAMRSWPKRMKQRLLSPFAFVSQVLVPSVFGYTILSPNLLGASILSPVVFNLELLTPRALFPVILGPRVLSPRILGPRVFVPQILLVNLLSPAIVRPLLFSPYILTPLVLSPAIVAPSAMGGRVLSPALLNPAILSPGAINIDVLSPTLLSRRKKRENLGNRFTNRNISAFGGTRKKTVSIRKTLLERWESRALFSKRTSG